MGIDVSKWNGSIDWNAVKNSGVNYVIIRVGYRGSSQGALIEDPKFKTNIKGATAAGLKVGVYFFTQAVDEVEAVQEASMVLDRISGYKISYPVFLDVEAAAEEAMPSILLPEPQSARHSATRSRMRDILPVSMPTNMADIQDGCRRSERLQDLAGTVCQDPDLYRQI